MNGDGCTWRSRRAWTSTRRLPPEPQVPHPACWRTATATAGSSQSRVFADGLVFPMGLAWRDGRLYVADPPDLVAWRIATMTAGPTAVR